MKIMILAAALLFGTATVWAQSSGPTNLTPQQREELRKTARQTAQEMKKIMSDFKVIYGELKTAMEEEGLMTPQGDLAAGAGDLLGQSNVFDEPKFMIVQMDMPGVAKDDLKIRLRDAQMLEVEAQREETRYRQSQTASADVFESERQRGLIKRSLKLPYKAAEKGFDAKLENGVLTVRIPKDLKEIRKQVRDIPVS